MKIRLGAVVLVLIASAHLAGCGGASVDGSATQTYTVGGTVSGLSGSGLVLQLNGAGNLGVIASGAFAFSTVFSGGSSYNVSVLTQPASPSQTCAVANGSGTVGSAKVTSISVSCTTNSFTIGGTVSGLSGTGLVLRNNGGNDLAIGADGGFAFSAPVASAAAYAVTVLAQPTSPNQICTVANGSGTVGASNVANVGVTCVNAFTIGGTVSGFAGMGLVLRNNGANDLAIAADGGFTFTAPLAAGSSYNVTVFAFPANQTCNVAGGSGTVAGANVTNVTVGCAVGFSIGTVSDALATQQWHLKNTGQNAFSDFAGVPGMDINVDPAFGSLGISGAGVTVAVVDTGLEIAHEDLAANVVPGGSWNFLNGTNNPTSTATDGDHGTSVAGLIAMARNTVGGIGVAPSASLKGFNFLSSMQFEQDFLDSLGGSTASPNSSDVFVFNQSFGISPTNDVLINPLDEAQYLDGVTSLRGGKGALYVKAAGNGFLDIGVPGNCTSTNNMYSLVNGTFTGLSCENANFDPDNAIPYQVVVGATNASGVRASYSTAGSAIWVSAPGGEFGRNAALDPGFISLVYSPAMLTTDQSACTRGFSTTTANNGSGFDNGGAPNAACNYTNGMNGTSSATPVTVGAIALVLEANPALTWRDVKHILALTARQIDAARAAVNVTLSNGSYVAEPGWTSNAAGFRFHNWYGFGMVDASAAVNMAGTYTPGQLGTFANTGLISSGAISIAIPDNSVTGATGTLAVPGGPPVQVIEAVQISVTATHPAIGDLGIELVSPLGTRSVLKNIRDGFAGSANLNGMVLLSNAFYGENPAGVWTIKVVDGSGVNATAGTLTGWSIRVFGH